MGKGDIGLGLLLIGGLFLLSGGAKGVFAQGGNPPNVKGPNTIDRTLKDDLRNTIIRDISKNPVPPSISITPRVSNVGPISTAVMTLPVPQAPVQISGDLFGRLQTSLAAETARLPIHAQIAIGQEALLRFRRPADYNATNPPMTQADLDYLAAQQASEYGAYQP